MFEKHKAKKAREQHDAAVAAWEGQRAALTSLIALARGASAPSEVLVLKRGEAVVGTVTGVGLVELRRGAGHYAGHSTGVSIPIGKIGGRSVRYRVGASRGHYVQGTPHPEAVDSGTVTITNQRIVFSGNAKSIECAFPKLISIQHGAGELHIAVSNRQKPTVLYYGPQIDAWVATRVELALALFHGEAAGAAAHFEAELAALDARRPPPVVT